MESELIRAVDNIANNIDALAQPRLIDWLAVLISVLSVLLSAAAICFAVKVADKQNKIMLFEKRYEIYNIFCKCIIFARMLENLHTSKDIIDGYKMLFFDKCLPENRTGHNVINEQRIAMIRKVEVCFYLLPSLDQQNLISIFGQCQRRTVKNLKRRPENDPNAGNIAPVIYAGTLSAGQLSAGSSAGGTGWTPAFHRSLSR